jgi:hypothetical protein
LHIFTYLEDPSKMQFQKANRTEPDPSMQNVESVVEMS